MSEKSRSGGGDADRLDLERKKTDEDKGARKSLFSLFLSKITGRKKRDLGRNKPPDDIYPLW